MVKIHKIDVLHATMLRIIWAYECVEHFLQRIGETEMSNEMDRIE